MTDADDVRDNVSQAYKKALSTQGDSCCGPSCCSGDVAQKSVVAQVAGYSPEELGNLPPDAVENSFGCGNPLAFSEVQPGDVVVDLGSGAGIDILLAGKKVGPKGRVIGIDMTDDMIARARANIEAAGLDNVEVRKGIIEKLPVDDSSVDLVISNCVINLSPEKDRVFAEIHRVLKPGGRMLVSDIVAVELPDWIQENALLYNACISGAVSEEEYLAGLSRAGLDNVEVRERLVYDELQMQGLIASETSEQAGCGCGDIPPDLVPRIAKEIAGKVWSAKVFARKP